jgi:hypothetical protein
VQEAPGFAGGRLLGLLGPHLGRLSSLVLVALAWDAARAAFVAQIEAQALAVLVVVVGDQRVGDHDPERTARVKLVPLTAIQRGQEIVL